jgi:hypothetical protein
LPKRKIQQLKHKRCQSPEQSTETCSLDTYAKLMELKIHLTSEG